MPIWQFEWWCCSTHLIISNQYLIMSSTPSDTSFAARIQNAELRDGSSRTVLFPFKKRLLERIEHRSISKPLRLFFHNQFGPRGAFFRGWVMLVMLYPLWVYQLVSAVSWTELFQMAHWGRGLAHWHQVELKGSFLPSFSIESTAIPMGYPDTQS